MYPKGASGTIQPQHWAVLPFVFGVVVGLSLSTVILIWPYTEHVVNNVFKSSSHHSSQDLDDERLSRFQELMEELHPASKDSSDHGPQSLAEEVSMKRPVHYALVLSVGHLSETLEVLVNTWTGGLSELEVTYFVLPEEEAGVRSKMGSNVVQLSVAQLESSPEIQVLEHVCKNSINTSKWFFFGTDTVYVKTPELESYLQAHEAAAQGVFSYLGRPVKGKSKACSSGPGSVLSHSALSELCHDLEPCKSDLLRTGHVLGECLLQQLPHVRECHDAQSLFLKNKRGSIIAPKNAVVLDQALTIYPVEDPKLMYNIHQLVLARRLNNSQHRLQEVKENLDKMSALLPQSEQTSHSLSSESDDVQSAGDLAPWQLVNDNLLMVQDEDNPAVKVPPLWRAELDAVVAKSITYLHTSQGNQDQMMFSKVINAYWRLHPIAGMEYIVDLETKSSDLAEKTYPLASSRFLVRLSRMYSAPEANPVQLQVGEPKRVTIAVVLSGGELNVLQNFMKRLEEHVLGQGDQRLDVVIVKMMSEGEGGGESYRQKRRAAEEEEASLSLEDIMSPYRSHYSRASFRVIESSNLLSRSRGLALVLQESRPTDLLFLSDVFLEFNTAFLERCRHLPIQGQQVYYPIPFAVAGGKTDDSDRSISISPEWGHWLTQSHSLGCISAADVFSSLQQAGEKGMTHEVDSEELYESLVESGYEVIRVLDSGLWKGHDPRKESPSCELDFVGELREDCQVVHEEPYDVIRMQTHLSELLFDHEGAHSSEKF